MNKGIACFQAGCTGNDGQFYFSSSSYNGLFCVDNYLHDAKLVGFFEGESLTKSEIHFEALKFGGEIFFFPRFGQGVSVFDESSGGIMFCAIPEKKIAFVQLLRMREKVLLIPYSIESPFVLFNLETKNYEALYDVNKKIRSHLGNKVFFPRHAGVVYNDNIYLAVSRSDYVLKVSMNFENIELLHLDIRDKLLSLSVIDNEMLCTFDNPNIVVNFDPMTNKAVEIPVICDEENDYPYQSIAKWDDRWVLIPVAARNIYVKYGLHKEFLPLKSDMSRFLNAEENGNRLLGNYCFDNGNIIWFPKDGNIIILSDSGDVISDHISIDEHQLNACRLKYLIEGNDGISPLYEDGKNCKLDTLIDLLCRES
jgi:hypothetical protein